MSTNNNKAKVMILVNDDEKHRDGDNYTHLEVEMSGKEIYDYINKGGIIKTVDYER